MQLKTIPFLFERYGLPHDLLVLIREGRLEGEIALAYKEHAELNKLMDLWEERNPEAMLLTPWYHAREAWKTAGRPLPAWYEMLRWQRMGTQQRARPLHSWTITERLLNLNTKDFRAKKRLAVVPAVHDDDQRARRENDDEQFSQGHDFILSA